MKNHSRKFFTLPDGTKMPLLITLPAGDKCVLGSPGRCQIANAMRNAGYRDPQVMKDNEPFITAIFPGKGKNEYRVRLGVNAEHIDIAVNYDHNRASPEGTQTYLPIPSLGDIALVKKVKVQSRKPRRDKGMKKADADRIFNRIPGAHAGRRAHILKFAALAN